MSINAQDETTWLRSLSQADRARFLASLSHNLTVVVRVLCHGSSAAQSLEQVRLINEVHHRVSSYLSHLHIGDEDLGWLPVVVEYVFGSNESVVHQQAEQAWSYAKTVLSHTKPV